MLIKTASLKTVEIYGAARLIGKRRKLKSILKLNFKKVYLFQLIETGEYIWGDECYWWFHDEMVMEFRGRDIKYVKSSDSLKN